MIRKAQPLVLAALMAASIALPRDARAQLTQFRLGGNLGYVYDEEADFIFLAAEARAALEKIPIEFAPRFSHQPASGSSVIQTRVPVVQPYARFEYSVLKNHFPNQGAIAVGALFRFKR